MVIKVLQIIRAMNVGGAETFIMNVFRNIDKSKIMFDFLVFGDGIYDEEIKKLGGKIYKLSYITNIGQIKYKKELKNFFKKHPQYKIIHTHIDQVSGIIAETAKESNIPCVISHSHSTKNTNTLLGKLYKKYLQSKINKNTDIKLACGYDAAKWLYKKEADRAIIINNGIDINNFCFDLNFRKQFREKFEIDGDTIVIGHVGRFVKAKNHEKLIDVFYEYQKKKKSILLLVGDGILRQKIQKKVVDLGLEKKVRFLGRRNDTNKIYSVFDFIVFPSLFEGLSLVLIEAQCNGLKMLISDTIDSKTNITGNVYFESLEKSAKIWADRIEKIGIDRKEGIDKIIEAGYDIKNTVNLLEKIYLEEKYSEDFI